MYQSITEPQPRRIAGSRCLRSRCVSLWRGPFLWALSFWLRLSV